MRRIHFGLFLMLLFAVSGRAAAQESPTMGLDPAPIRETVEAYSVAFNKGDAVALAAMWTEDAVYTNQQTGEEVTGRPAIVEQFKGMFAEAKRPQMTLTTDAIQFLSPHVAVEHGTARMLDADSEPELYQYTAVYVKQSGKWLLDRVTDEEAQAAPYYDHLKQLEWMIGSWSGSSEATEVKLVSNWATNKSFITRSFSILSGEESFSGTQILGWDPLAKTIRCWTFDQNGTFAEGVWAMKGDTWTIVTKGVLPDGTKSAMINVMKQVDGDTFTWKTVDRISAGEILPNLPEITLVRDATP